MNKLTDINKDFAGWYQDVITKAELVDSSPTRGCMVLRPYGYAIWENIQKVLDIKIKELGAQNAYFPLLIPESFLKKEAEHVGGFAPEVAVVTHAGGKKLEEPLVIRPTSETIIYYMFAKWIHSWRDLPLKINQWANVMRWEMRPRAFLRTAEFLWQEGHTAHESKKEADEMAIKALEMYKDFMENFLAIPIFAGVKTDSEKFAGAEKTYCAEAIMPDGKGLQMGTTHLLAKSFPVSFGITYQDKSGETLSPYCSSWGVSTRMIGGLIMSHGDENGLVFPPMIAPIQVVIIPIYKKDKDLDSKSIVLQKAESIKEDLIRSGVRVVVDSDDSKTPGSKFFHWELKGVPVRIELGIRDIKNNKAILAIRNESDRAKKKVEVNFDLITKEVSRLLKEIQKSLFDSAKRRLNSVVSEDKYDKNFDSGKAYITGWCSDINCENSLKDTKGTIRCILDTKKHKKCFCCDKSSIGDVLVAKAY